MCTRLPHWQWRGCVHCFEEEIKNKNHLPLYGAGPVYVAVIITVTMAGILLIAAGAVLWFLAVFDGADEMYRGKVAEKFIWCGI